MGKITTFKREIKAIVRQMVAEAAVETRLDSSSGSVAPKDILPAYQKRLADLDRLLNPPWTPQLVKEMNADLDRLVVQVITHLDAPKKAKPRNGEP